MAAKFKVGDKVKVVRLLDETTNRELIGFVGTVNEVEPLCNGETNYTVSNRYLHEAELELVK